MNWLLNAILNQNSRAFTLAIENSSPKMFDQVFDQTIAVNNIENCNVLHAAAVKLSANNYKKLIDRIPDELLNIHISAKNKNAYSGLLYALIYVSSRSAVQALIDKLSEDTIKQIISDTQQLKISILLATLDGQGEDVVANLAALMTESQLVEELQIQAKPQATAFTILAHELSYPHFNNLFEV